MDAYTPRIRGRIGIATEPEELVGQWMAEISLWTFEGNEMIGPPWIFGPYADEKAATKGLRELARKASEAIEMQQTGKISGQYYDITNGGVMRNWDEN